MVVNKSKAAFRTIAEVADRLGVGTHVLRFWETKFDQIKPLKMRGGRRFYRPDDVKLLETIRELLYDKRYTIEGVQKLFSERGTKAFVGEPILDDLFAEDTSVVAEDNNQATKAVLENTVQSHQSQLPITEIISELTSIKEDLKKNLE